MDPSTLTYHRGPSEEDARQIAKPPQGGSFLRLLSGCLPCSCLDTFVPTHVRLVVFDFDQTLSILHMFKVLAGWQGLSASQLNSAQTHAVEQSGGKPVHLLPEPHSVTQRGQVRRIAQLNKMEPFSQHGKAGFVTMAFGGDERVAEIRRHLQVLKDAGAHVVVCSRGLTGTIKKCLKDLGLLELFSDVYGNDDAAYREQATAFDKEVAATDPTEEEAEFCISNPGWNSKNDVIKLAARKLKVHIKEAILVDDDPHETSQADAICETLLVQERMGITPEQMAHLEQRVKPPATS